MAGQVTAKADELGGSTDQVGDDRVETPVDLALRSMQPELALGKRGERSGLVLPGNELARAGPLASEGGLLGQDGAVPGERGVLSDLATGIQTLLGDPAA